ncbi:MAG TPA: ATP-binding cassette domain-containing protein [Terracidiphilus sp.]|jgi:ABC-2 type transport system ATP-binding protein
MMDATDRPKAAILATSGTERSAPSGPALLLRGLRKAFADVQAVDGLDLEVAPGECFGLLGPNGAGKTTTIEICEGLTAPDAGAVELLGLSWRTGGKELRQRIGIQLQETQFPDKLTVEEALRLFRSFYRRGLSVDDSIRTAQLEEKRRSRIGGLSGGQKQRLAMACALVGDPELLFLDEPTTGLDPQARRHLWDLVDGLKQAGRTIILTTHYMDEAERLCDRVAIMDHGKVIALGTPQQLIASIGGEDIVEFAVSASPVSKEKANAGPLRQAQGRLSTAAARATFARDDSGVGEGSRFPTLSTGKSRKDGAREGAGCTDAGKDGVREGEGCTEVPTDGVRSGDENSDDGGRGGVEVAALLAIPGVRSHRVDAGLHQLSVSELHTAVPRIFAALARQGLHLSEFRTHSATLEDVFVRLTGRNLRDE